MWVLVWPVHLYRVSASACGGQRGHWSPGIAVQMVVNIIWVLGTKLRFPGRAVNALNHKAIFPASIFLPVTETSVHCELCWSCFQYKAYVLHWRTRAPYFLCFCHLRFLGNCYMCFAASKQYFEKYPGDHELLWEVEGVGHWHQRIPVTRALQREAIKVTGKTSRIWDSLKKSTQ